MEPSQRYLICIVFLAACLLCVSAFGSDKVLLQDIQALTLKQGHMTNGRRSSPVPQLKCVGGSAMSMFNPQVVQCYNRGFDGRDIQWECKADVDTSYRFGQVEVTCEGYDYPDDPYVLKGSCGLEYTLELTEEGRQKKQHGGGSHGYSNSYGSNSYSSYSNYGKKASSVFGDLIALAIVALILYGLYRMFVATPGGGNSTDQSFWSQDRRSQPPPPGFRSDYMPGNDGCGRSTYDNSYTSSAGNTGNASTGGGFWTGAATGGLLGYLFGSSGSRTYNHYQRPYYQPYNSWWGSPFGGRSTGWGSNSGFSSGFSGGSSGSFSSGTRTASGFGGTRRR